MDKASKLKGVVQFKGVLGLAKIGLIFIGVLVCLLVALPLAPFVTFYFVYDRRKTHKERIAGIQRKSRGLGKMLSVNDWANEGVGNKN